MRIHQSLRIALAMAADVTSKPWSLTEMVRVIEEPARSIKPGDQLVGRKGREMPAYFVAEIEITERDGYASYAALAGASVAQYGGKSLVRGGKVELVEGGPEPNRVVITEFADIEAARRWYHSPEYQAILPIRLAHSRGRVFIVEGA